MRIGVWELCTAQPPELKLPQMVPVSPEAAAVGRYVDYPVDYCTGVVKTEIPLYEIKVGDLVLPVTLSYHASGLKVKEPSGWVGSGWTLNCEPSIMRTVHGLPDEESYPNTGFLNVKRSMMNEVDHYYQMALGRRDGEPDAFYFKLADSGGKFYIDRRLPDSDNFQAQVYPAGKEKISFGPSLSYFILTDENGIMYQFDTKETMGRSAQIPTRWMGSSIHSPTTGSKISFEYLKQEIELTPMFNDKVTIEYNRDNHHIPELLTEYKNGEAKSYNIDALGNTTYRGSQSAPSSSYYMDQNIQRCRISRVAFENSNTNEETGHIVFTVSPSFRLQKISVYDALGQPVREALFYITPFNAQTEHAKLDSLHILNATGNIVERYRFLYQSPDLVPSIYTLSVDHWGYFNAADNTGLVMVPLGQVGNLSIGKANRNASSDMDAGVLKRIFRPGGRMTEFGYEINSYVSNYVTQYVGGLRIKTIDDRDRATGTWSTRVFDYDGEYAIEKIQPILDNYRYDYQVHTWTTQGTIIKPVRCYQSNAIANLMFSTGAPITYGKVTETRQGNDLTGPLKTDYYYTARNLTEQRQPPFTPHYFEQEKDWMYGVLQKKIEYRWENGAYTIARNTVYELGYTGVLKTGPSYQAYFNKVLQPEDRFSLDEKRAAATYQMNLRTTEKILVKKETQYNPFPGGGSVVTEKNYEYNNNNSVLSQKHLNPIKITSTTSTGTLVETFAYPEDIAYSSASSQEQGRLSLVNANMIHKPMEYKRTENGATTTTEWRYLDRRIRDIWSKIDGASFQPRMMIHEYNAYGNPACVSETSELKTMYIWGYNNQYPIAKIEGFRYYSDLTSFIGLENLRAMENRLVPSVRDWETIRNMQNAYPNILITTYTYQPPAGIRSETDPSGRTVYYEYDAAGRLKWIQDESGNILKAHYYHLVHGSYY
jgi:YD repeat-containing protein